MEFSHIVPSLLHTYLVYLLLSENICLRPKRDATWIFSQPWIMVAFQIRKSRILDATFLTVLKIVLFSCLGLYLTILSMWGQILWKLLFILRNFSKNVDGQKVSDAIVSQTADNGWWFIKIVSFLKHFYILSPLNFS